MHKFKAEQDDYKKTENWEVWEHGPGEFPWIYPARETCLILEGSAIVRNEYGNELEFREGDIVIFEKGLQCHWKIKKKIVKRYLLED